MLNDILKRTSCRKYLDKPIEVEKINKLKEIINSSPTALNLQDFSCIFVTDKQTRDKIAIYAGNQRHISEAPLFIAFYGDHNRLKDKAHWAVADAIIATTLVMIAAESLGLQTCLIGHIIYQEENMNKLLNVSGNTKLAIGITIGYAQEKGRTPKKVNRCYDEIYNIDKVKQGL